MEYKFYSLVFEGTLNYLLQSCNNKGWKLVRLEVAQFLPHGRLYDLWFRRRKVSQEKTAWENRVLPSPQSTV